MRVICSNNNASCSTCSIILYLSNQKLFRSITNLLVVINLGNKGIKLLFAFSRMYEILLRFGVLSVWVSFCLDQRKRLILLYSHFQWIFQVGCFRLDIYCNDLMLVIWHLSCDNIISILLDVI